MTILDIFLPKQKTSKEDMEGYNHGESPPLQQSDAHNLKLCEGAKILNDDVLPPDDVHVEVEHVQVHEAPHWPREAIEQACQTKSFKQKI